jgi:molybdenum cofactor synthesis domain-containing protein
MPKEGIFCRVIRPGSLKAGDVLEYQPKVFKTLVITLSDRAFEGIYEDRSGPRVTELLGDFFREKDWRINTSNQVIPDDGEYLERILRDAIDNGLDLVFTTGGTGIGPRDITPEAVRKVMDYEIPGIMEMIRPKFGMEKPNALLSRSIAARAGRTLIFALPGSIKAVNEYMAEITRGLQHMIYMLHGLDSH